MSASTEWEEELSYVFYNIHTKLRQAEQWCHQVSEIVKVHIRKMKHKRTSIMSDPLLWCLNMYQIEMQQQQKKKKQE